MNARRGDTEEYTLTVTRSGEAVDLTGKTLRFTVKVDANDPDTWAVIQAETGAGIENADQGDDETKGKAVLTLVPIQTQFLLAMDYVYDVQLQYASGEVYTVESGTFTVSADVTRTTD